MADLLPGTPRALRFWISAELGGPSTSRGFASRSRSCIPGCSTGSCSALPCTSAAAQGAPLPSSLPSRFEEGSHHDPSRITSSGCLQCPWCSHPAKPSAPCGTTPELLLEQQPAHPGAETPRELRHFQVRAVSQRLGFQPFPGGPDPGGSLSGNSYAEIQFCFLCAKHLRGLSAPALAAWALLPSRSLPFFSFLVFFFKLCVNIYIPPPVPRSCCEIRGFY